MATHKSPVYVKAADISDLVHEQNLIARFYVNKERMCDTLLVIQANVGDHACDFIKRNCASLRLDYIESHPKPDVTVFVISFKHTAGLAGRIRDIFTSHNFQEIDNIGDFISLARGAAAEDTEGFPPESWRDQPDPEDLVDATESCTDVPHGVDGDRNTARELGLVAPGDVVSLLSAPEFKYTVVADVDGSVVLAYRAESGEVKLTQAPLATLTRAG